MKNKKSSSAEALGFSVEEVEREFEFKLEQLDILGAKRDLYVGQLIYEYHPRFVAIAESSDQKLETYYQKRFHQDPSNVQRYMRVWAFWNDFALKDGHMTLDDLAKYANTKLDSVRRLLDRRKDAIQIIGKEIHLNPVLVTDGRGTHLKDFTRPEIDRIEKNLRLQQERRIVSLSDKGIEPDSNSSASQVYTAPVMAPAGNDASVIETVMNTGTDNSGSVMLAVPEVPSDSMVPTASSDYPHTFRGKVWPGSEATVEFVEGDVLTDNSAAKYIYRTLNCRVQVVVTHEGAAPQVVVKPIEQTTNGSAIVWLSGQYDDDGPVLMAYTYDAQFGLGKPTRFVKMEE